MGVSDRLFPAFDRDIHGSRLQQGGARQTGELPAVGEHQIKAIRKTEAVGLQLIEHRIRQAQHTKPCLVFDAGAGQCPAVIIGEPFLQPSSSASPSV